MNAEITTNEFMKQLRDEVGNPITIQWKDTDKFVIDVSGRQMPFAYSEFAELKSFLAKVREFKQETA